MRSKNSISRGKKLVAAALSFGLAFSCAPVALAEETNAKSVEEISAEMNALLMEAEQSQYDLISANNHLDKIEDLIADLDVQIDKSSQELEVAKRELSKFVSEDYKQGGISLLDILVNASSFDDFIAQVTYANKITEHKQQAIVKVDNLYSDLTLKKSELEQARADQELYISQQAESQVQVEAASAAAAAFIEQLPPDVVEQLASADAEQREQAMQASMEALATMDESQLATIAAAAGVPVTDDGSADGAASAASSVAAALSSGGSTAASSGGSSSGSTSYSDMLSRVYSLLGSGYQWSGYNYTGDNSTSSFTCSGVVDYALGRDSQSSSPETLYEEVGSNITTDVNSLQAGDLVFYSYGDREVGHVGVYVGDGQVIDSIPNGGVAVRDVNYMDVVGGGSLSY